MQVTLLIKKLNELNKKLKQSKDSGITLTKNEMKDIRKVFKSLGNRGVLLRRTTEDSTRRIKSVLTSSVKSILIPLGFTAAVPAANAAIQKKFTARDDLWIYHSKSEN